MKKFIVILLVLIGGTSLAEISPQSKMEISSKISDLVVIVNDGSLDAWDVIISPTARPGLKEEIIAALAGRRFQFEEDIKSFKEAEGGRVKVKGSYSFKDMNTSINGLPNFFIFENVHDRWALYDTNFHKKLDGGDVVWLLLIIFGAVFIIGIPLLAFWIWMLVDAITKCAESKTAWILVLIFTGLVGAIIYFFLIYRKRKKGVISSLPTSSQYP